MFKKNFYNFSFLLSCSKTFYNLFGLKKVETEKERELFTNIWYKIWLEEVYATDRSIIEKKRFYEKASVDFLIKILFLPIGTVRIIFNSPEFNLPILTNFEIQENFEKEKIVEISLFTIKKRWRFFHLANIIVIKRIYKFFKNNNVSGFLAALDHRLYLFLTKKLRLPFHKIGKEKIYEGSLTYPVYLNLREAEEFMKKNYYQIYNFFVF